MLSRQLYIYSPFQLSMLTESAPEFEVVLPSLRWPSMSSWSARRTTEARKPYSAKAIELIFSSFCFAFSTKYRGSDHLQRIRSLLVTVSKVQNQDRLEWLLIDSPSFLINASWSRANISTNSMNKRWIKVNKLFNQSMVNKRENS